MTMQSISMGDVPPHQRLAYLHDFVASHIAGLTFEPANVETFEYELMAKPLELGLIVSSTRYSAVTGRRRPAMLADGRADYVLSIHDTDYEVEAGGSHWRVAAGDVMVIDEGSPYSFRLPGARSIVMALERRRLIDLAPGAASRPAHHFRADSPAVAMISGYADLLRRVAVAEHAGLASQHAYQLVAALFEKGEPEHTGSRLAVSRARLNVIKAEIDRQAANPSFSIGSLARRQKLTPRYIQQLFAREDGSFSDYLRQRRLELARRDLEDPGVSERTIAEIAFDAGFGDLSSFNRAFRQSFGMTPREVRAKSMLRSRQ